MRHPTSAYTRDLGQEFDFLDLFCGCGGFTLGMQRAGFRCLAAIDFNAEAVATLKANLPDVDHALERDMTKFRPDELAALIGVNHVDVIVGGPPCQGFSTARQVDGANHGKRLKVDPRRHLYRELLRYVDFFQPRVFVIENVLGLRSAAGGTYFTAVQKEARELGRTQGKPGYRVHSQVEDVWELGVPQKRRRQLIIGVRNDLPGYFLPELKPAPRTEPRICLGIAIGDLPILRAGGGQDERDYDLDRRAKHLKQGGNTARKFLFDVLEVGHVQCLTNHVARPHNDRDLRDFALLKEGENSATAMRDRCIEFEFPYDKTSFKDRYTRQSRYKPCSTIVAHLSKDGLMFIHPTQNRSFTPREAARAQSFPDWFKFPKARTHAFRLIGNAVPPLVGEAVGLGVKEFIKQCTVSSSGLKARTPKHGNHSFLMPVAMQKDAIRELDILSRLGRRELRALAVEELLRGWNAILFLFPDLHPDNARDHGHDIEQALPSQFALHGSEELFSDRYVRSGWPVGLQLLGLEVWRRYRAGELGVGDLYGSVAHHASQLNSNKGVVK